MARDRARIEALREDVHAGGVSRRDVVKRGVALGLGAPAIAGLLAACGGAAPATGPAAAATGAASATAAPSKPSAATGAPSASPSNGGASASPTSANVSSPAATVTGAGAGAAETPGKGRGKAELLRILYWQAPTILNPHLSQGNKDWAASSLVLEPLIDVDVQGNLIPVLAAEVPTLENGGVTSDGKSVTYKLKKGVVWSDGTPFTAEDVKFTWQYVSDAATAATTVANYGLIADIQAEGDTTVTITFKDPAPAWYSPFSTGFGGQILPKHILQDVVGVKARDAAFNLKPIGTGPYVVREFRPGDVITYDINESYREADKPYFKQVEFKGGGDAKAAATAALQTGETDWAWNLQVEKTILESMANGATGVLLSNPGTGVERILLNFADPNTEVNGARSEPSTQHPFLTDKAVRQALALATDRDTIATQLYGPTGTATANLLVAPEKFASKNTTYAFDTAQAAKLLDDADWTGNPRSKNGVQIKLLYQTTINPLRQKTQEVVKQGWEQIGCPTELKSVDAGVFFSSDAGNPDTVAHFYADAEMGTDGPSNPYPIDFMTRWKSSNPDVDIPQKKNSWAGRNYNRWVNADYNRLWEQARVELDPATQVELFTGMNELVVNEVVAIALVARADVVAANTKLKGYRPSPWTPDVRDIANWYFEE